LFNPYQHTICPQCTCSIKFVFAWCPERKMIVTVLVVHNIICQIISQLEFLLKFAYCKFVSMSGLDNVFGCLSILSLYALVAISSFIVGKFKSQYRISLVTNYGALITQAHKIKKVIDQKPKYHIHMYFGSSNPIYFSFIRSNFFLTSKNRQKITKIAYFLPTR